MHHLHIEIEYGSLGGIARMSLASSRPDFTATGSKFHCLQAYFAHSDVQCAYTSSGSYAKVGTCHFHNNTIRSCQRHDGTTHTNKMKSILVQTQGNTTLTFYINI